MASSYKVDIGGLLAGGRQRLAVEQPVELEPFEGVRFPKPARVRLELRVSGDMLEVAGLIDAEYEADCDRCLEPVKRPLQVEVDEQLDATTDSVKDPFGPGNVLTGERLDVKDLATQLVCGAIPLTVVCAESCKGLCPHCGANKNAGTCACADTGD